MKYMIEYSILPLSTGYEYFPMPQGEKRSFAVKEILGHVVRVSTGEVLQAILPDVFDYRIDILDVQPHGNSPQYTEFYHDADCLTFGNIPFFVTYNRDANSPDVKADNKAVWTSFGTAYDGLQMMPYVGEVRNHLGNFTIPPEPQLPLYPFAGQVLDVLSSVYISAIDPTVARSDWRCTLYVLDHVDLWKGRWPDCWITVLTERSGQDIAIYEYVFAKAIGIVDLWFGVFHQGNINGYEYILI